MNDWRELYPFESHHHVIAGHRLHYLDEGTGPVLLMVHGNPTWSFYWRELVKAFRGQYRVVVPDHIGCGLSDKPHPKIYPYHLKQRISDLGELIYKLDLRGITLLVHDWGGAIGMGAAVEAPDRFARFVLFNTAVFRSRRCPVRIRVCRVPFFGRLGVQGLNLFARGALGMAVSRRDRMTPAVRAGLLAPYDAWENRAAIYQFVADIPLDERHPSYPTLRHVEAHLKLFRERPMLLIWGMRDWCFTPRFLERLLEFFPQAEAHRLEDAGHYVLEDAHEQIVPLVQQFLEANPLT